MSEENREHIEEQEDYLKYMHTSRYKHKFNDDEIERTYLALQTTVDATNSTEALNLAADIITAQLYCGVDIEKFEKTANYILKNGNLLGADDAVKIADSLNFRIEVRRENITDENVNRVDPLHGNSFLESSLYSSKSPEVINAIIDKGGRFGQYEYVEGILDTLIDRVADDDIKNNLENIALLINRGLAEKPKDLGKLASNSELFEKYPEVMSNLFEGYNMQEYKNAKGLQDYYDRNMSWVSDPIKKAQARVKQRVEQNKAMTADIKEGMAKTQESGYKHISRTSTPNTSPKGGREE